MTPSKRLHMVMNGQGIGRLDQSSRCPRACLRLDNAHSAELQVYSVRS